MPQTIKGGNNGNVAHVDNNKQVHVYAISEDEQRQATNIGNEYNLNTGLIALTGSTASAIAYFKNDESPVNGESNFVFTQLIVGVFNRSVTVTDDPVVTIIRNPTGGDIISDATAMDMVSNTNFGSTNTLSSTTLAYKGKDGGTVTGGTDHAIIQAPEGRTAAKLNIDVPKGSSLGVKIDLNTSGGCNVYLALVGYRKLGNNT
jgi:hypothetical protein